MGVHRGHKHSPCSTCPFGECWSTRSTGLPWVVQQQATLLPLPSRLVASPFQARNPPSLSKAGFTPPVCTRVHLSLIPLTPSKQVQLSLMPLPSSQQAHLSLLSLPLSSRLSIPLLQSGCLPPSSKQAHLSLIMKSLARSFPAVASVAGPRTKKSTRPCRGLG